MFCGECGKHKFFQMRFTIKPVKKKEGAGHGKKKNYRAGVHSGSERFHVRKEADTVESYNRMLGEQKEKEGEAFITTALFSDQCRILGSHIPLAQAAELTEREYFAEGNTALFDAIAQVFGEVSKKLQKEGEDAEERVLVFIITDGLENASTEYGPERSGS